MNFSWPEVRRVLFAVLLLLSGFCGISYEILYARILGNLVGDQFAVTSSVLLTFLLGIGFGTLFAHHLWRYLWLMEAGVGLYGVGLAFGTDYLDAWLYSSIPLLGSGLGSAVFWCFLVLSVPAFLIGCSLPLFAGYLATLRPGRVFAWAYTVYNFGAALTVLLIEFWLVRALGIRNTVLVIAALNGLVSLSLVAGFARLRASRPTVSAPVRFPSNHLLALVLASTASAVFQLLMVKVAECFLGPFRETFALVLALVLAGIALGSAITEKLGLRLGHVLFVNLVGLLWLLGGLGPVTHFYASVYPSAVESYLNSVLLKVAVLALLMGLPAMSFGATIPALLTVQKNVARESGQLLFVSSVSNAFGFLLMAFFLHRYLDYGVVILVIAGLTGLGLIVYLKPLRGRALAVAALLLALGLYGKCWNEDHLYLGHTAFHSTKDLQEAQSKLSFPEKFKGYQDVFSINWIDGKPYFFINGYVSIPLTSPSEKIVGAFSSVFAPRTDRALVLGLGSGATAGTVGLLFDHTDAIEINPVVLENLYRMSDYNFDIETMARVAIIQDDAIHYTKRSDRHYSMIINTVTTPLYFSSSKLYTHDFLRTIRQRLTPDGIYVTWIDSRVGDRGLNIILKTLSQTFPHCAIGCIKPSYFLLICSRQAISAHHPNLIAGNEVLAKYFLKQYDILPQWIPYGLLTSRAFDLIEDAGEPVNTLDYPCLEFEMARLRKRGISRFKRPLRAAMSLDDVAAALGPRMDFHPMHLLLHMEELLGDSSFTDRWRELMKHRTDDFDRVRDLAELEYYRISSIVANTADAHHKYGFRLLEQRRYQEAIDEFRRALQINPARDNSYFNIGACYEKLGQLEPALVNYQEELLIDPEDEDVPFRLGRVYLRLERFQEALEALDKALAMGKDGSQPHLLRGHALVALGRPAEAKEAYRRALRKDPDSKALEALEALAPPREQSAGEQTPKRREG